MAMISMEMDLPVSINIKYTENIKTHNLSKEIKPIGKNILRK